MSPTGKVGNVQVNVPVVVGFPLVVVEVTVFEPLVSEQVTEIGLALAIAVPKIVSIRTPSAFVMS
jgi:hypothetical protein